MCSGLRGKAMATLVMRSRRPAVAALASTSGKNTSWEFSNVNRPSVPVAISSAARSAAPSGPVMASEMSTNMWSPPRHPPSG